MNCDGHIENSGSEHFTGWTGRGSADQTHKDKWLMMDNYCHLQGSKMWPYGYKIALSTTKAPGNVFIDQKHPNYRGLPILHNNQPM